MTEANFQDVRDRVLEIANENFWFGKFYAGRLGQVAIKTDRDFENNKVLFGTYSKAPNETVVRLDVDSQDDTYTGVHTTDFRVQPPVTRLLIPTAYGNFTAMFEGRAEDLHSKDLATLHSDTSAIGKMIVADVCDQLKLVPSRQTEMSLS